MVFLDANPVIYLIEQPANLGSKVTARVSDLLTSGERLAVSDLVRMECQVGPLKANDAVYDLPAHSGLGRTEGDHASRSTPTVDWWIEKRPPRLDKSRPSAVGLEVEEKP
jgi:hypothetical protein